MVILFEILFQFLGELLLQVIFEILFELGLHGIAEPFRRKPNPWLAALGHALLGVIAGALSLWAFPTLFIHSHSARLVSLVMTPVFAGCAMVVIGALRRGRDQKLIRFDRFSYGYLFALAMALMRFYLGH